MRRALLIGAQTHGLTGVVNDVAAMAETLDRHGFVIHRCEGGDATRGGILEAYQRLISDAEANDVVVVYYSGHGGYIRPPARPDTEPAEEPDPVRPTGVGIDLARRPPMQFIVPTDYDESSEDDFRGITAVELSVLQAELTTKTKNVVVALDCCHAAYMSRDPDLRVKALYRPAIGAYHTVTEHITRLRRQGLRVDLRHPVGNEHAVRIVACAPEQSAYEYTNSSGVRIGMLTEALTQALIEATDLSLTWFTLMQSVRRRVLNLAPDQRPEVEGPSRRLLFSTTESDPILACPVAPAGAGRVNLPGARLLGSQVGDEFTIMPPDAPGVDPEASVGVAVVDRIGSLSAQATLRFRPPWKTLPTNARAYRSRAMAPALPVRLPPGGSRVDDLAAAITRSPLLRVATPDDSTAFEVRINRAGQFVVHDRVGALHSPRFAGPAGIAQVVTDLERLARATALRQLTEDPRCLLSEPITVEWGRVTDAGAEPLAPSGSVLHEGERVYVRVRNEGQRTVYVSLVDIGLSARIAVLTNFSPSGVRLSPGEEYVLGFDDLDGRLVGVPLIWPDTLLRSGSRLETILAIVTSAPQDVGLLQQEGVRGYERGFGRSPLEDLLAQVALGTVRDLGQDPGPSVRYAVRTIDFLLAPTPPPPAETAPFLIDDRPAPSVRLLATRGAAPSTVAVRLHELVVHRNRALGGADVRVDAVVLTGGDAGAPAYRAQTERFHNIRDGDRLPLDRMLIYHGPAVDYLDLAIWVSRDTSDSLALSDLLREQLGSQEVQEAGLQLAGLMVAAPQAATAVAAVGAGAVIINVAYRLLLDAVGKSIGLYRTSLLAQEGFGVGRHPTQGLLRAQDFSFAFTIDAVD